MSVRRRLACRTLALLLSVGATAQAQVVADREEVTPPDLRGRAAAPYPADALAARQEAVVGLELDVGADGLVRAVRIVAPAGRGFDEAAREAASRFTFVPAMQGGRPVASTVRFDYEFRLPAAPPSPSTPPSQPTAPAEVPQAQSTLVLGRRVAKPAPPAATAREIARRDLTLRPVGTAADLLRATPGLVVMQHAGGGKANQYFLRGFDADHGTDVALSIDGVPVNMVSHAHGQGFADTSFVIPELVDRLVVTKGPYFADQGDFATAGAIDMITRDDVEHASAGFAVSGSPGHGQPSYRALVAASPRLGAARTVLAAEVGRSNGPFEQAEKWDRYKLFQKVTIPVGDSAAVTVGASGYTGTWRASGQLPARAVERGVVGRFGFLDPTEGGSSARHQAFVRYRARLSPPTGGESSEVEALAYAGIYRFDLYSNFTFFARDAERGDGIHQGDRRTFAGGSMKLRLERQLGGVRMATTFGGNLRHDAIDATLDDAPGRVLVRNLRDSKVQQTGAGAFVMEEVAPVTPLRLLAGARADHVSYAVAGSPASGVAADQQISPKLGAVLRAIEQPRARMDLFVHHGHGFHSNDARGALGAPPATPLVRAIGSEIGARTRLLERLDLAAAIFQLDLASETVWVGDEGTTEAGGRTRRQGIELETRYQVLPWLWLDGSGTLARAVYRDGSDVVALAPRQTWAAGLSARHPSGLRAGLRGFGIAARPATEDGALTATGFTQVDLHLGYRQRRFDVALDLENLLDSTFRNAQFATLGRLRGEPAIGGPVPAGFGCGSSGRGRTAEGGGFAGCEDIHFTSAPPFTLRLMTTLFLD